MIFDRTSHNPMVRRLKVRMQFYVVFLHVSYHSVLKSARKNLVYSRILYTTKDWFTHLCCGTNLLGSAVYESRLSVQCVRVKIHISDTK